MNAAAGRASVSARPVVPWVKTLGSKRIETMARKQADPASSAPVEARQGEGRERPAHEVRIGRIKAVIWANQTDNGLRHNVTLRRIFKRDGSSQWESSDSFGRDDLPAVMEVTRQAWLWIFEQHQG
ncbi:MAG: hypothetical protein U0797_23545 [Gemmataceae bacterium]